MSDILEHLQYSKIHDLPLSGRHRDRANDEIKSLRQQLAEVQETAQGLRKLEWITQNLCLTCHEKAEDHAALADSAPPNATLPGDEERPASSAGGDGDRDGVDAHRPVDDRG